MLMQHRWALICPLLTLTGLVAAQDLQQKIDYTTKAVSFSRAFAEIGKQAHIGLFAEPDLANEIIVLRLKDVSLQEAMDRIANTVGAKWVQKSDGYELDRPPEVTDKLRADALKSKGKAIQDAIAHQWKALNVDKPMDQAYIDKLVSQITTMNRPSGGDDWRAVAILRNSLPDQRNILRLFARLDPTELATLQDGDRMVFSNKPTRMQHQIDGDLDDIAEALKTEHNAFLDTYEKKKKPADTMQVQYVEVSEDPITAAPTRFLLSVSKQMFSSSYQVSMIAFDGSNHALCTGDLSLDIDLNMDRMLADRARIARQNANEPEIQVSPVTKQFLSFVKNSMGGGGMGTQPVTGELRQALINPEENDPLSYAASEAFLGTAEQRNENLVLYPDDTMFLVSMMAGMEGSLKPSLVLQAVQSTGQILPMSVDEKDGWLTIAPVDRMATLDSRVSRAALGKYLRQAEDDGFVSLRNRSTLAASINGSQMPVLALFVPMMIHPEAIGDSDPDITMLKFYSTLNDWQLQRLEDQQQLRLGELTSDQLGFINRFVYGPSMRNQMEMVQDSSGKTSFAESAARSELTETLANGLSPDSYITMKAEPSKVYFSKLKSGSSTFTEAMDVDTLAWYAYMTEHPNNNMSTGDWHPEIVSIDPGEKRTLTIDIHRADGGTSTATLKEERIVPGGPWTLKTLPDDLKQALAKSEQRFSNQNMEGETRTPAPQSPPPPSR